MVNLMKHTSVSARMKKMIAPAALTILFFLMLGISMLQTAAPAHLSDHPSMAGFSFERVHRHLEAIASAPHPAGSAEHEQVRHYIVEQIRNLGLNPDIQSKEIVVSNDQRSTDILAVEVHNVIAVIKGTSPTQSLVLMSHYDTESYSPGANDNGVAVAAMLETMHR